MARSIVLPRRTLALLFVLVFLILAGVLAALYLPSATITLSPAIATSEVTQTIVLSSEASEPDFVKFVLPARVVEKTVEEEKVFTREGAEISEDFATGVVELVNDRDEEQQLLPKTHLKHEASGVYFLTDSPVAIPPTNRVSMNVTAKEKGESGNVPAGKFIIDKLPASLQSEVYAESNQDFTGGIAIESPLTEEEISSAKEALVESARQKAVGELTLSAGGAPVRDDLTTVEIEEESVSAEPGSKTQEFRIKVKVRARAFVVDDNDLLSLTLLALRGTSTEDEEFVSYRPDSFGVNIERANFDRGQVQVVGSLTGEFAKKVGPRALEVQNIAGLSREEVISKYDDIESVGDVEVSFWPFWVDTIPGRPGAVEVLIKNEN